MSMDRVLAVVRVHLVSRAALYWPWAILACAFAVNLAIFGLLGDSIPTRSTGGLMSIYIVFIFSGQGISQYFPYALGMSISRTTFYLATSLVTIGLSIAFGLGLYLLSLLEQATGGWGIGLHFYRLAFMNTGNPLTQILMYIVPFLVLGFIGTFCAVVLRRWGANGIYTLTIGAIVAFSGVAALITWQHGWQTIVNWIAGQSTAALIIGWPSVIAALLAIAGYAGLRHATA
jgi:hypothetical protein